MLSRRKVQADVPSPSHFSRVLLCFQNQVESGWYLQEHFFLPSPFGLENSRMLATGFEFLQLLWIPLSASQLVWEERQSADLWCLRGDLPSYLSTR